ncbi:hypothetical protein D3C78_1661970 [compost metagenome]
MAVRRCKDRNNRVPVHRATISTSSTGVCTNIGTSNTAPAAPTKVPMARYTALELVGPTKGLETM